MSVESSSKVKLLGLTSTLEMGYQDPTRFSVLIDAASQLCNILKDSEVSLSMSEKTRVLKSVTKAKVKAFMSGPTDDYRTFKTLDAISGDLVRLL